MVGEQYRVELLLLLLLNLFFLNVFSTVLQESSSLVYRIYPNYSTAPMIEPSGDEIFFSHSIYKPIQIILLWFSKYNACCTRHIKVSAEGLCIRHYGYQFGSEAAFSQRVS